MIFSRSSFNHLSKIFIHDTKSKAYSAKTASVSSIDAKKFKLFASILLSICIRCNSLLYAKRIVVNILPGLPSIFHNPHETYTRHLKFMSLNELSDQPTVSTVTTVSPICPRGCEKKDVLKKEKR